MSDNCIHKAPASLAIVEVYTFAPLYSNISCNGLSLPNMGCVAWGGPSGPLQVSSLSPPANAKRNSY